MALHKGAIIVTAVAAAVAAVAAPKTPAHLASNEELLGRLRVYSNGKKEEQFKLCVDNVTTPFFGILNPADDTYNYIGQIPGFDGSDEDKEAVREHYVELLRNDPIAMAHAVETLKVRAARLAATKAAKASKELATKAFKANLATQATTAVAASTLANDAA